MANLQESPALQRTSRKLPSILLAVILVGNMCGGSIMTSASPVNNMYTRDHIIQQRLRVTDYEEIVQGPAYLNIANGVVQLHDSAVTLWIHYFDNYLDQGNLVMIESSNPRGSFIRYQNGLGTSSDEASAVSSVQRNDTRLFTIFHDEGSDPVWITHVTTGLNVTISSGNVSLSEGDGLLFELH